MITSITLVRLWVLVLIGFVGILVQPAGLVWADDPPVFVTTWGSQGSANGQFDLPSSIAVDSADNIYIVDIRNNRIQKFDGSGAFLVTWGSSGSANGQFFGPNGVAIDSGDKVYMTDANNSRIQKFDSSGNFLTKWGSLGSSIGQFNQPFGIAVDSQGNIYVSDANNYRVQKFGVLPDLTLTKTVNDPTPKAGQRITYTLIIVEHSGIKATNAVIKDNLPPNLTFAGPVNLEGAAGIVDAPPILVSGLTISPGLRITVTFPVTVNVNQLPGTIIRNTASISSSEVPTPITSAQEITIASEIIPRIYLPLLLKNSN